MDVAFVADKGGVGKTTLAYHVATRLRQLGQDAALLDLDRRSAAVWWSRQQGSPYVPAYALSELSDIPEHSVRIWDTPAHISGDAQDRLTGLCDLIITVTTPDALSVIAAGELSQSLIRRGGRVAVVLNNVHPTAHDRTLEAFDGTGAGTFATVSVATRVPTSSVGRPSGLRCGLQQRRQRLDGHLCLDHRDPEPRGGDRCGLTNSRRPSNSSARRWNRLTPRRTRQRPNTNRNRSWGPLDRRPPSLRNRLPFNRTRSQTIRRRWHMASSSPLARVTNLSSSESASRLTYGPLCEPAA